MELKKVLNVWVKETDEILHVSTSGGEVIDTTTNHPFYVEEKGWVAAGDLEVGDILYTADGDEVEVTDLELEKLAEPITVYNLEVEDFHTYFVGEYGVLVHNYIGDNGTVTDPKTAKNFGGYERIDFENPFGRDGNIHYHDKNNKKYYYDIFNKIFLNEDHSTVAPSKIQKLLKDEKIRKAINKALEYWGETEWKL